MNTAPNQLISIPAAAAQLGVTAKTIRSWISEGRLRAYRLGPKLMRIDQRDLDVLVRVIEVSERSA